MFNAFKDWRLSSAVALLALTLLFIFAGGTKGRAQDANQGMGIHGQGHAENHDWYQQLKQPGTGYSCCNGTTPQAEGDCRPARVWENKFGDYTAIIEGKETFVPPRAIIRNADGSPLIAPDGRGHICASKSGMIYCGILSPPRS